VTRPADPRRPRQGAGRPADAWPDWTDEGRWALGPDPSDGPSEADRAWAAYHLNAGSRDYFVPGQPRPGWID
jgi:hypothetical protein